MIYSLPLEKQVLSGLLRNPDVYGEIADFIGDDDFYSADSRLNRTVFQIIRNCINSGETVDATVVSQRVKDIGITNTDDLSYSDYISSLSFAHTTPESTIAAAKELKKFTIRREIYLASKKTEKEMLAISPEKGYTDIIEVADKAFNKKIDMFQLGTNAPINLVDEMIRIVEDRGNNPITDFGYMGPHKKLNEIYGSLLRPGNITVFVARSAVGKTTLVLDFITKVGIEYDDAIILHFDNGEMSEEELSMRQCAAISGVPMHLLETGEWRMSKETTNKVRGSFKKVKNLQFYYYNVGGMTSDQMISILKRFYFSKVGRGNKMIFSFDYIKTSFEGASKNEWQVVGEMLDKFKRTIQREIVVDGSPMISMMTSVQSNRYGITNNKTSDDVVDDESVVSLSDRITQLSSHLFILRNKTLDEIAYEGHEFGTHKLINLKSRHLGRDTYGHFEPIVLDGKQRKNFINFDFNNFGVVERGDGRDIVSSQTRTPKVKKENGPKKLPDFDDV
jgi:replicative DNA helicase